MKDRLSRGEIRKDAVQEGVDRQPPTRWAR